MKRTDTRESRDFALYSGRASNFLLFQVSLLAIYSTWALGGRLEGAIIWIGWISTSSLFALALDPNLIARIRVFFSSTGIQIFGLCYLVLGIALLLAPLNAMGVIEYDLRGNHIYRSNDYFVWLPSAFVVERCREYGCLLVGVLIQVSVLWLYMNRLPRIERLLQVIAANGIVLAIAGVVFRLMRSEKILGLAEPVHPAFFASFRYHNHWTAYAILCMGACAALICIRLSHSKLDFNFRRQRPEVFWLGVLFLFSLTLPMTTARAGVLLMALFWLYILGVLLFLYLKKRRNLQVGFIRIFAPLAALCFITSLVVFAVWSSAPSLRGDWEQTKNQWIQLQEGEIREIDWARTDSWGDGLRMFRDSPVWGWGFGSHRYLYQIYARDEYRNPSGTVEHIKEFAHNDWMQYLAELGFVGLGLLVAPPLVLLFQSYRRWREPRSPAHWIFVVIVLILLLATFEFPLSNPAVIVHFSILLTLGLKLGSLELKQVGRRSEQLSVDLN